PRLCRLARLSAEADVDRRSDDSRTHQQAGASISTHAVNAGRSRYFAKASKLGKTQFWPVANGSGKPPASQRVGDCPSQQVGAGYFRVADPRHWTRFQRIRARCRAVAIPVGHCFEKPWKIIERELAHSQANSLSLFSC